MTSESLGLTRRKFMIISSAAIASPLLLDAASSMAATKTGKTKSTKSKITKGTKIYFINRTCIGCQVCRTFCPAKAIHYGDGGNEIDQNKCIHCGTCFRECLISAISETEV